MLQEDHITKLLGIANVSVKNVEETGEEMRIYLETSVSFQICPVFHKKTRKVHDYRRQRIRDLAVNNKPSVLILRKRRYHCPYCGKNFYERYEFLPRYAHRTKRVTASVIRSFEEKVSCKETARRHSLSSSTVLRLLECRNISHGDTLPEVLGIDECKGNAGGEKYQCILTDIEKRYIVDILPDRRKYRIMKYLREETEEERRKVKFLVCDMWADYRALACLFPNAQVIADKYRPGRQVSWALGMVRKRVQKEFSDNKRLRFRRNKRIRATGYCNRSTDDRLVLYDHAEPKHRLIQRLDPKGNGI